MAGRNCWIGVVTRDHVALGVAGGYAQLNHGRAATLERMREGDGFAYYSPRAAHPDGEPVQAFTAIGVVAPGPLWQVDAGPDWKPFRRAITYWPGQAAPIKPLLPDLTFIRSKQHWGAAFRFGVVRVPEGDFARIAAAMGVAGFATAFAPAPP
ncbi:MAG: EVE domain-containing protein [Burkholderiales bacterium]